MEEELKPVLVPGMTEISLDEIVELEEVSAPAYGVGCGAGC